MDPDVTVVVCTRDRPVQLEACLRALASQQYPRFDILVVNNGRADGIDELCRAHGAACIREPVPGLTRARNLGARAARAAIVAFIDDDAVAEPGWLTALAAEFADPAIAAVAGRTRYMKAWGDPMVMSDVESADEVPPRPHRIFDRDNPDWFAQACFGRIGDGNTMAFRRSVLTEAVRFDERLGRGQVIEGGDEHVAFMSLISDGHRVSHAPAAVVRHPIPAEPAARQRKRVRDLRGSVAYVIFLWQQFPGHRADIARFLARAFRRRLSGGSGRASAAAGLSTVQTLSAVAGGVATYRTARRQWRRPAPGGELAAATPRVVTLR